MFDEQMLVVVGVCIMDCCHLNSTLGLRGITQLWSLHKLHKEYNSCNEQANYQDYHYDAQLSKDERLVVPHHRIWNMDWGIEDIKFQLVQNTCISQPHHRTFQYLLYK